MNIVISTPFKTNSWDQRLIFFFLHLTVVLWLTLSWMNHYVAVGLHLGQYVSMPVNEIHDRGKKKKKK